jgi:CheY-like chemotaxis protein
MANEQNKMLSAGFDDYLPKPILYPLLKKIIRKYCK